MQLQGYPPADDFRSDWSVGGGWSRNLEKGTLEKGYLHKIVRNRLSNSQQIAKLLRTLPLMYETKTGNFAQIRRAICDKFARRPAHERPLLGIFVGQRQMGGGGQNVSCDFLGGDSVL